MFVWKRPKLNEKEAGDGPFKNRYPDDWSRSGRKQRPRGGIDWLTDDQHDGGSDHAQNDDVVDGHPDEPRVVDLTDFDWPRLVGEKQAQDELQTLVAVHNTWK